jgi:plastocyanin
MTTRKTRVLSLAAALCLVLAACSSDPAATTGSTTATVQNATVEMADMAFTPASVTITPGSTVTWTNNDTVPHIVSFGDQGPQSSEVIDPGATFSAIFEEPGSFSYVCTLHPGMSGVVEVNDIAAAAGSGSTAASSDGTPPTTTDIAAPTGGGEAGADARLVGAGTPGVDIAQGEWALVPSTAEAPPGTITFRFRNLGTVSHALRIRTPGSGSDRLEWRAEAVAPGESGLLVADLAPGTYEIDCPVEDGHGEHDGLGMEMLFTVRDGAAALAPLPGNISAPAGSEASGTTAAIAAFAFEPAELRVPLGTAVTWTNNDPTAHTVTGDGFNTGPLEQGTTGTVAFDTAGTFDYFCAIHPTMRGSVIVEP